MMQGAGQTFCGGECFAHSVPSQRFSGSGRPHPLGNRHRCHAAGLEQTEGVVIKDADQAENAIIELRAKGVRLALDDFGIGYSSLIYLRRFAFDKIKIDRSFLQSMEMTGESAIILHSIVHLGRALGLTVTAEGIENEDQRRFLQALGCHELQGFLFSQPLDADELMALIQQPRAAAQAVRQTQAA
jgi:EAL domain-containing protein (putative c-di-GMP-specific phosphodiesterase class I)